MAGTDNADVDFLARYHERVYGTGANDAPKASTKSTDLDSTTGLFQFTGKKTREDFTWARFGGANHQIIRDAVRAAWVDSVQMRALVGRLVQSVVNTGLTPEPKPAYRLVQPEWDTEQQAAWEREVQVNFQLWARSTDVSTNRRMNFAQIQAEAFRRKLIDGEVFAVVRYLNNLNRMSPVSVQFIDPDQVDTPHDPETERLVRNRGNRIIDGIEVDANDEPVAYYVRNADTYDFRRIPARGPRSGRVFMLHDAVALSPGDVRGTSPFAPVIHELSKITDYSVAELQAAVVNATIAAWVQPSDQMDSSRPLGGVQRRDDIDPDTGRAENPATFTRLDHAGIFVQNLKAGESIQSYNTQRPNVNFDSFVNSIMKQVSASVGMPVEVLHMTFNQNYSASRASLLLWWNTVKMWRADLEAWLLNPLYEQWLVEAVGEGVIAAAGINSIRGRRAWARVNWIGINHPSIDPLKEANAAAVRISEGLTTRDREAAAYNGSDFSDNAAKLAEENASLAEANAPIEAGQMPLPFGDEEDEE